MASETFSETDCKQNQSVLYPATVNPSLTPDVTVFEPGNDDDDDDEEEEEEEPRAEVRSSKTQERNCGFQTKKEFL